MTKTEKVKLEVILRIHQEPYDSKSRKQRFGQLDSKEPLRERQRERETLSSDDRIKVEREEREIESYIETELAWGTKATENIN